jgi:hypothetical protein
MSPNTAYRELWLATLKYLSTLTKNFSKFSENDNDDNVTPAGTAYNDDSI